MAPHAYDLSIRACPRVVWRHTATVLSSVEGAHSSSACWCLFPRMHSYAYLIGQWLAHPLSVIGYKRLINHNCHSCFELHDNDTWWCGAGGVVTTRRVGRQLRTNRRHDESHLYTSIYTEKKIWSFVWGASNLIDTELNKPQTFNS